MCHWLLKGQSTHFCEGSEQAGRCRSNNSAVSLSLSRHQDKVPSTYHLFSWYFTWASSWLRARTSLHVRWGSQPLQQLTCVPVYFWEVHASLLSPCTLEMCVSTYKIYKIWKHITHSINFSLSQPKTYLKNGAMYKSLTYAKDESRPVLQEILQKVLRRKKSDTTWRNRELEKWKSER